MKHRFFDDTGEIDHYLDVLREYIEAEAWDLVEEELDLYIRIVKGQLKKLGDEYIAISCNDESDAVHSIHDFRNYTAAIPFIRILYYCYSMKTWILPEQRKEDSIESCEEIRRWIKEALLELTWPVAIQEQKRRQRGGKESAQSRKQKTDERNQRLVKRAKGMLEAGIPAYELAGRLTSSFELSERQIRNILQKDGVIKKRK